MSLDEMTDDDVAAEDIVESDEAELDETDDGADDSVDDVADGDDYDDYDDISTAERVLDVCLRSIVDDQDAIEIDTVGGGRRLTLHVSVASDDMGKIIGKRGRVANALRAVVKAAGGRDNQSATVEIDD